MKRKAAAAAPDVARRHRPASLPLADLDAPAVADLAPEQRAVVAAVARGANVFLTGCAGCGKTKTALALKDALEAAGTCFAMTASTGVAANLLAGSTLHSLVGLQPGDEEATPPAAKSLASLRRNRAKCERLIRLEVLVIDEVSMVSAEALDAVVHLLSSVRARKAPTPLPVMVLIGDYLQLPPVRGGSSLECAAWGAHITPVVFNLKTSYRQGDDAAFVALLNQVRMGALEPEAIDALQARTRAVAPDDGVQPTVLMSYRNQVDAINTRSLRALDSEPVTFRARMFVGVRAGDRARWEPIAGSVAAEGTDKLEGVQVLVPPGCAAPKFLTEAAQLAGTALAAVSATLQLKVGAQVMFTANVAAWGVVNGMCGTVVGFQRDGWPSVRVASGRVIDTCVVQRAKALGEGVLDAAVQEGAAEKTGPALVCELLPLTLAWALTIHKSQGATITRARVSLKVFADGQAYVALSRVPSLDALFLEDFDPSLVKANPDIVAWYRDH